MENILTYVKMRNDISFGERSMNPLDALVFSILAYVEWEGIVLEGQEIPIQEACQKYVQIHQGEDERKKYIFSVSIPLLIQELTHSSRFDGVKIKNYRNVYSEQDLIQFSCVTFVLPDSSLVLSYRGTDGSITGWKENMIMTYMDDLPCQKLASDYLKDTIEKIPETSKFFGFVRKKEVPKIYVTGHSKGGNLAMYASFTNPNLQSYIEKVYNFDGPGFNDSFYEGKNLEVILPKVITYLPPCSVFGRLLTHKESYIVVDSEGVGLLQHESFNWKVTGTDFIRKNALEKESDEMLNQIDQMILQKTKEEKIMYVDLIYSLLDELEIKSVLDLTELKLRQGITGLKLITKMSTEERKFLFELVHLIRIQSAGMIRAYTGK